MVRDSGGQVGVLGKVQTAINRLGLEQVNPTSWASLREPSAACLDVNIDHVGVGSLLVLANVFQSLRGEADTVREAFWRWLSQPVDHLSTGCLLRSQASIVVFAQGCSSSGLCSAAGAAYVALLSVEGAEQLWGTLFQPLAFRSALSGLRVLLARERVPSFEEQEKDLPADDEIFDCVDTQGTTQHEAAELLLRLLLVFFRSRPLQSSHDLAALALGELTPLLSQPKSDCIAQTAAAVLVAVVDGTHHPEEKRRVAVAVLRSLLPALLMTSSKAAISQGTISKSTLNTRTVALKLARDIISGNSSLLIQMGDSAPAVDQTNSDTDAESDMPDDIEIETRAADTATAQEARKRSRHQKGTDEPVLALLQLACISVPDRAEWRTSAVEAVIVILIDAVVEQTKAGVLQVLDSRNVENSSSSTHAKSCAIGMIPRFLVFLDTLLHAERVSFRVFATHLAAAMMEQSVALVGAASWSGLDGAAYSARGWLCKHLLEALAARCEDAVPSVRSHAVGGVATGVTALSDDTEGLELLRLALHLEPSSAPSNRVNLPKLFRSAALDDKAFTRRASVSLFESCMRLAHTSIGLGAEKLADHLQAELIGQLSLDDSVMVRKSSISSFSLLLKLCPTPQVCVLWAQHLLPLVLDVEGGVVDRALEEVEFAVVRPLMKKQHLASHADLQRMPGWDSAVAVVSNPTLPVVLNYLDSDSTEYLQRAVRCFSVRHQAAFLAPLTESLLSIIQDCLQLPLSQWPSAVWSLLEELASTESKRVPADLMFKSWLCAESEEQEVAHADASSTVRFRHSSLGVQILNVLESVASRLSLPHAYDLSSSLRKRLSALTLPTEQVQMALRVMKRLEVLKLIPEEQGLRWRTEFLQTIEQRLAQCVRHGAFRGAAELHGYLVAVGELALLEEATISEGIVHSLQSIVAGTATAGADNASRSHALAALGKLCLRREALAKRLVELFVLHLGEHEPIAVRNNAVIILSDLCVHYTALVDRFVPCMAHLLRDPSDILRKQTAMVFASLLCESFVKFRGSLMYRVLYVLSDPAEEIRNIVECLFTHILHKRDPAIFSHNFVGVICVLNGWTGHPSFQGASSNAQFNLTDSPQRRQLIYRFMLSLMSQEQKFHVCAQLVTGFLSGFVDSEGQQRLPLPRSEREPGGQVLSDAFALLCCKEMRVCFNPKLAGQDDDEVGETGGMDAEAARSAFAGLLRKVIRESIVPMLVQLKDLMEEERSPFLGRLRSCLCEMVREFKDDLQHILQGDTRLAEEVAYDLGLRAAFVSPNAEGCGKMDTSLDPEIGNTKAENKVGCCRRRISLRSAMDASVIAAGVQLPLLPSSPEAEPSRRDGREAALSTKPGAAPPASQAASAKTVVQLENTPHTNTKLTTPPIHQELLAQRRTRGRPKGPAKQVQTSMSIVLASSEQAFQTTEKASLGQQSDPVLVSAPATPRRLTQESAVSMATNLLAERAPVTPQRMSPGVGLISAALGLHAAASSSCRSETRPSPRSCRGALGAKPGPSPRSSNAKTQKGMHGALGLVQLLEMHSRTPPPSSPAHGGNGGIGLLAAAELHSRSVRRRSMYVETASLN